MVTGRVGALVASLFTSASILACQRDAAPDAIESVTAALTPAAPARSSPPPTAAAPDAAEADAPGASMPVSMRLSNAAIEAVIPSEIAGTWEVVEVLVNRQDGKPRTYHPHDARLVGRSL